MKIAVVIVAILAAIGIYVTYSEFSPKVVDSRIEKLQRENATLKLLVEIQYKGLARCGFIRSVENKIF